MNHKKKIIDLLGLTDESKGETSPGARKDILSKTKGKKLLDAERHSICTECIPEDRCEM